MLELHAVESMDPYKQSGAAQMMPKAVKNGATCIDCHKRYARQLSAEPADSDESEKVGTIPAFRENS